MPVLTAGLYKVDLQHQYLGEQMLNTFWYRHTLDANDEADNLADGFDTDILPLIALIQSSSVTYSNIRVTPIFGTGVEINLPPTTANGALVGTDMATYMAVSIRLNRSTNELRNGWKRFAGLLEENTGATSFAGGYNSSVNTLATALADQITTVGAIFNPYIVRRPFSTKQQSPNWEGILVASAIGLNRPTSQTSRKTF